MCPVVEANSSLVKRGDTALPSSVRAVARGSLPAGRQMRPVIHVALTPVGDMSNRQRVAVELRMGRFIP